MDVRALLTHKNVTLAGMSICLAASGYMLYQLYANGRIFRRSCTPKPGGAINAQLSHVEPITRKSIILPSMNIGLLIGRNGVRIKALEQAHNVHISIHNRGRSEAQFVFRGSRADIERAEAAAMQLLGLAPSNDSELFFVPESQVSRIIGHNSHNINFIRRMSGAYITICSSQGDICPVKFLGTEEQVKLAKRMITEYMHQITELALVYRGYQSDRPANSPKKILASDSLPRSGQETLNVCVSACTDPSRVWIQIEGPALKELDLLITNMTEYYNYEENRMKHQLKSLELGCIVAGLFSLDRKWYRAEVIKIIDADRAEVLFLDYGDTEVLGRASLCELRFDFIALQSQAVECFIYGIQPTGGEWSRVAIDIFEDWAHSSNWKAIVMNVSDEEAANQLQRNRSGFPLPGVELFANKDGKHFSIAENLVLRGFAVYDNPHRANVELEASIDRPDNVE